MKLQYFRETDTLYINLRDRPSTESEALTDDLIIDFGADGQVVGITIDNFSKNTDSTAIETILGESQSSGLDAA
jgi:uncharacterized protein YuzE